MSGSNVVSAFLGGQMLHYAGEAGELEAKVWKLQAEIEARKSLLDDLVKALSELNPDHHLIKNNRKQLSENLKMYYRTELRR